MVDQLAREWWLVALRGVLSIAFGIFAFIWPGITLVVLVLFFGAYMLVGVLSITVGVAPAALPGAGLLASVWLVGACAIIFGVSLIGFAPRLRRLAVSVSQAGFPQAGGAR